MKNIIILIFSIFLFSCVKKENKQQKTFGAIPDKQEDIDKVPVIFSNEYYLNERGKPISKRDTDKDGILDVNDECPGVKETYNGYQDTDGCPDTPPVISTDSDKDGIPDKVDSCVTKPETYNGYLDGDGCPDTLPVIPPPPAPLPASHFLTMPPIQQQGSEGSCLSVSVLYVRDYEAYKRSGATSYSQTTNILSPEMLYNRVKGSNFDGRDGIDCSGGSALLTNLNYVRDTGVCLWSSMPYSWQNGCTLYPSPQQLSEAQNFRYASYSRILASDTTAIKTMLSQNRPLVSQITVDGGYVNAGPSFIWNTFTGALGAHGMVLSGYDDSKRAFIAMGSWGTTWGDQGYIWVDYNFLKTVSSGLYVMNL